MIWRILAGLVVTAVIAVYVLTERVEGLDTKAPPRDTEDTFTLPLPERASRIVVPVRVNIAPILRKTVAEIENPILDGSKVIEVPARLRLPAEIAGDANRTAAQAQAEAQRVCARTETVCTQYETRVKQVCTMLPPPLDQLCNTVEEQVCVTSEQTCVAFERAGDTPAAGLPAKAADLARELTSVQAVVDHTVKLAGLDVAFAGDAVTGVVDIAYRVRLNAQVGEMGPRFRGAKLAGIASCGYGESMRKLRFHVTARLATLPDLALRIEDQALEIEWLDDCRLTAVDVSVRDLIELPILRDKVRAMIDEALGVAVAKANEQMRFRSELERLWPQIAAPIPVAGQGWLVAHPEALAMAPIRGEGKTLTTRISVLARPVITTLRPEVTVPPVPKVTLGTGKPELNLTLSALVDFERIEAEIDKAIAPRLPEGVAVGPVDVYGSRGRIVIALPVRAPVEGTVYLVGRGRLGDGGRSLSFPNLDYALESGTTLVSATDQLVHDRLRDTLRSYASVDFSEQIDAQLAAYADETIALGDTGHRLRVKLASARATGFAVTASGVNAVVTLKGRANLRLKP